MPTYPVHIVSPSSLQRTMKKTKLPLQYQLKQLKNIEDYLNDRAKNKATLTLTYADIAEKTGTTVQIVRSCLQRIGGGSYGITIQNPNLDSQEA